jgi:hypothetical protein
LHLYRTRLQQERDREEGPRQERERELLRGRARSIERQCDRNESNERKDECE